MCRISGKRRDCFWGEWSGEIIYINRTRIVPYREYKRYRERQQEQIAAHGGIECSGESEQVLSVLHQDRTPSFYQNWASLNASLISRASGMF